MRQRSSDTKCRKEIKQADENPKSQWQNFEDGQKVEESGIRRSTLASTGAGERTRKQMQDPSNKAI